MGRENVGLWLTPGGHYANIALYNFDPVAL